MANVLKWLKNIMSCLHYIINILSHGINPGENIDSMADEVKKQRPISTTILFQPNCSCMFKRCIFIRILVLRTHSYLRIPLNGRFVFLYFSYSLCIFIFHVFCTSSINHYVALCKNSVNDVCKTMLSLYICTCTLRIIPWLSTFFSEDRYMLLRRVKNQ